MSAMSDSSCAPTLLTPPVLPADANQAAKDAAKLVDEVVVHAYDEQFLTYEEAFQTYHGAMSVYCWGTLLGNVVIQKKSYDHARSI